MNYISMSYTRRHFVIVLSFLMMLVPFFGHSQIIKWDPSPLTGGTGNYGPSPWTPSTINANLAFTGSTTGLIRGSSLVVTGSGATSCYGASGGFTSTAPASGEATSFYFQFTVNSGYVVSLTTISGSTRKSSGASAPTGCDIHYSVGGGAYVLAGSWSTTVTSGVVGTPGSTDLSGITALQNVAAGTVIKIRITPTGGTGGSWYFTNNSLALAGTVSCTGTPSAGTATAGVANICNGSSTTIALSGGSAATGISYQWQQSATGSAGSFSNVTGGSGATTLTYTTPTTLSSPTYYQCVTTCSFGGGTNNSSSATLGVVSAAPVASATVTPNPICSVGGTLSLSGSATNSPTSYSWSGPGSFGPVATSATTRSSLTSAAAGTYTFSTTNAFGTGTVSPAAVVGYTSSPTTLSATTNSPVCSGSTLTLIGSAIPQLAL